MSFEQEESFFSNSANNNVVLEDDDVLDQTTTSTIAVILLFGSITFATCAMAARTWLLGDYRPIVAVNAISAATSTNYTNLTNTNNHTNSSNADTDEAPIMSSASSWYSQLRQESSLNYSFLGIFILLYHIMIFGFILFGVYVLEHHPPFHHHSLGLFDADYLVFLCALGLGYAFKYSIARNDGKSDYRNNPELDQHHETNNKKMNVDDPNSLSVYSGRSKSTRGSRDSSIPEEEEENYDDDENDNENNDDDDLQQYYDADAQSKTSGHLSHASKASAASSSRYSGRSGGSGRSGMSGKSGGSQKSKSSLDSVTLDEELTIQTPTVAASTIVTQRTGYTNATGWSRSTRTTNYTKNSTASGGGDNDDNDIDDTYTYNTGDDPSTIASSIVSNRGRKKKGSNAIEHESMYTGASSRKSMQSVDLESQEQGHKSHASKSYMQKSQIHESNNNNGNTESNIPSTNGYKPSKRKERFANDILNVHQSLEWKGLLMACFLLYRITGGGGYESFASSSSSLLSSDENIIHIWYNMTRVGGSCFAFLTGFGHAMYYYKTNDYKFGRILKVLVRYNLSAFWLCLTLGRPYIFYSVCPLHSCIFLMTYMTMSLHGSALNYTKFGLRIKILVLGIGLFLIWDVHFLGLFQIVSLPFFARGPPSVGVPDGPMWEWYYVTFLHHWAGFVGMIYAINYPITNLLLAKIESMEITSSILAKGTVGLALACAFGLWTSGPFTTDRYAFDLTHPYFGFLPILTYVYFRNIRKTLRERHIAIFKSLGAITLELYLLHHHFFLSSHGTTILVILPGYPKCNLILIGVILVNMARLMHRVTTVFCETLVPSENDTLSIRTVLILGGLAGGFYAMAAGMQSMGMVNMGSIGAVIIACGFLLYQSIIEMTWEEYRHTGGSKLKSTKHEPPVAKFSPPLIGAMLVFLLGTSWHLLALVGATATDRPLPAQCDAVVNDGIWAPVNACSEYQRGHDYRDAGIGSYYRDCDDITNLQWGWRSTTPASHCRFHSRDTVTLQNKLNQQTLVFIGDSMVQQLFYAVCRAVGDTTAGMYDATIPEHGDVRKTIGNIRLEYKWAPLAHDQSTKVKEIRTKTALKSAANPIDLLILGGGTLDRLHIWATDENPETNKEEISKLAKEIEAINEKLNVRTVWCTPTTVNSPALGTEEKRNQMNELVISETRKLYADLGVENAASFVLDGPSYSSDRAGESYDGIHYPSSVYDAAAQIMANAFDWLILSSGEAIRENFEPPVLGTMGNPLLGMMMMCFGLIGLLFFDGYFGFSYLSTLLVRNSGNRQTMMLAVMPNDLYEEAFAPYHQYLKLPMLSYNPDSASDRARGISVGKNHVGRSRALSQRQPSSTIEDSDILSLLDNSTAAGPKSTTSETLSRRSRSGDESAVSFRLD